jgi:uncharacterized protein YutE (UPF0331/DUF86 family)
MKTEIVAITAAMIIKFVKKKVEKYSEFMKLITPGSIVTCGDFDKLKVIS